MLQKMKKIQVVGPKKEFPQLVDLLYQQGTMHLEDACKSVSEEEIHLTKVEKEESAEIADILSKISGILTTLPQIQNDETTQAIILELQGKTRRELVQRVKEVIHELESVTKNLAARKSDLKLSVTALDRYVKILNIIQPMERELPVLENYEVTILLIQKQFGEVLRLIREEMEKITGDRFEMTSTSVDEETLATLMIFHKRYSQQVHSFIYSVNVNEVRLPQEYMGKPFYEMFAQIETNKLEKTEEMKLIDEKLARLSAAWYQELLILKKMFEDISGELEEFNKFGCSEFTFVVRGWIPKKYLNPVKEAVKKAYGERVVIQELKVSSEEMEKAPTFYDNPRWVKPFEFIMKLVRPPLYSEIDPSPILAIFFPIFFGMMVGDVGYGLVICFLLLKAPDLAIVQIVVETITLIIMVAVVLDSSREEQYSKPDKEGYLSIATSIVLIVVLFYFFKISIETLDVFGSGSLRMAGPYIEGATDKTGSANLVTGVVFDFRGYDTMGEATVLVTAVLGVLTILRIKGRK